MRYKVGAEHSAFLESRSIVPGGSVGGTGQLVPRGITHAIDVATGAVACGRSSEGLTEFPELDWERAAFLVACHECREAVLE